jgi:hypothetical protein
LAATEPERPSPVAAQELPPGDEPLTADLTTRGPLFSTRVLVAIVLALVVVLVVSLVVGFVILHQPRLTPVPVPSVSSIA